MKYKILNTDILLEGKLLPEGTITELTKEQTIGLEDYLQLINNESLPTVASSKKKPGQSDPVEGSNTKVNNKSKRSKK